MAELIAKRVMLKMLTKVEEKEDCPFRHDCYGYDCYECAWDHVVAGIKKLITDMPADIIETTVYDEVLEELQSLVEEKLSSEILAVKSNLELPKKIVERATDILVEKCKEDVAKKAESRIVADINSEIFPEAIAWVERESNVRRLPPDKLEEIARQRRAEEGKNNTCL